MIYRFDDIAYNITTKRVPTPDDNSRYIGLEHLDPGELYVKRYGSNVDLKGDKLVMTKGDILFGKRNTYLKRVAIAPFDGLFSAHGMIFHPKEDVIDKRYFPFFINSDAFMDEAIRISVGSLSPTVNWKDLKDLKFDIPPIEEQKQLADKLWIAYDLKSKYANLVESIDEMVKSQFIEIFGNYEMNANFGDLFSFARNGANIKQGTISGGIPITRIETISEGEINRDKMGYAGIVDNTYSSYYLQDGDILVSHINSMKHIGKCALYQRINDETIIHGMNLLCLRPYKDIVNPQYVTYLLRSSIMRKLILDITKPAVNQASFTVKDLCKLKVMLPPISEQEEFVAIVDQADKSKFSGLKSQFIEMFGSVDYNPKSYNIKKVGDFAVCFAGATPSTKIPSYWDNGNIPWMSSGEVHKGRVQDTDTKITRQGYDGCSTKMVPIHSIVVALAGQGKTRGTVAINDIELCTNQSLCAIVPNEEVNYEYLFHNLRGRYRELRSMSGDVDGRGGLNLKHIQSIKVIVPPMSEQMKFVSIARQADKSKQIAYSRAS